MLITAVDAVARILTRSRLAWELQSVVTAHMVPQVAAGLPSDVAVGGMVWPADPVVAH